MKKMVMLVGAVLSMSSASFASVKACGTISQDAGSGALLFNQATKGQETVPSPIYASSELPQEQQQEIHAKLSSYVGLREVCVKVSTSSQDEGDTVITDVISVQF